MRVVGCGVWGVGCGVWGVGLRANPSGTATRSTASCHLPAWEGFVATSPEISGSVWGDSAQIPKGVVLRVEHGMHERPGG